MIWEFLKKLFERKVLLPQTKEEYEALIETLVKKYKLPDYQHASVVVANGIKHLGPDQDTASHRQLAARVRKNVAYQIAENIGSKINHEIQVDQLASILKVTPNDQQARDALEKASKEGSLYAQAALDRLDGSVRSPAYLSAVPNEETPLPGTASEPA